MTFTSPFQPQPLCDSDDSISAYKTDSTEGPNTAGENVTQNHSNFKIKMDSRKNKAKQLQCTWEKKRTAKRRVHHVTTEWFVFYRGL